MAGYELGINVFGDVIGSVNDGTNIMLLGPPASGKDVILNNIIYNSLSNGEGVILVSTKESGESVFRWFEEGGLDIGMYKGRIGIVDCVSKVVGMGLGDTENIKRASSPVNLTGISVGITNFFEEFWMKRGIRQIRLCIDSLSTLLMYTNLQAMFRFLHVHTRRVKTASALGVYVVEDGMHDAQTMVSLQQLFDATVKLESEGGTTYMQAIGLSPKPTKWFEYEIEGANLNVNVKGGSI
jgi:KaiC/GvpD/RAD55 family RecA-like ATPase